MSRKVKCDRSCKEIELSKGCFVCDDNGNWFFMTPRYANAVSYGYVIPVKDFIKSAEEFVDWMAHLSEKGWFDQKKFFTFFKRIRNKLIS